jgi:hypothetical protein
VPRQVESAVNVVWKGNRLMTPIGGGVSIQAAAGVVAREPAEGHGGAVAAAWAKTDAAKIDAKRWWWD